MRHDTDESNDNGSRHRLATAGRRSEAGPDDVLDAMVGCPQPKISGTSGLSVLLADLSARGIELQARGDRLRFQPRSRATPDLGERLHRYKAELLAILQGGDGPAAEAESIVRRVRADGDDDLAEAWHERLSICTADGGLTLAEAATIALAQLQAMLALKRSIR